MGGKTPETCWATHKRQVINLWNRCILLVELFDSYDDARTGELQIYVAYVFVILGSIVICRLHKLTLSEQGQVTLKQRAGPSDVVQKIFSRDFVVYTQKKCKISLSQFCTVTQKMDSTQRYYFWSHYRIRLCRLKACLVIINLLILLTLRQLMLYIWH